LFGVGLPAPICFWAQSCRNFAASLNDRWAVRPVISLLGHTLIVSLLSLLTQIGGVAYLAALPATWRWRRVSRWRHTAYLATATVVIYAVASIAIVPPLAAQFGRVRIPCATSTWVGCVLNRTYARPQLAELIDMLNMRLAHDYPGSRVTVLDAGFPFFDGFPLPPHLSHHDGRKVDLAYFYRDARPIARGSPSPVGYFHYQQPRAGDHEPCVGRITPLRWDFAWLQPKEPAWVLDEERARAMVLWLKGRPEVTRILIEPHLAQRLGVSGGKVRFQGCFAARHDDHLPSHIGDQRFHGIGIERDKRKAPLRVAGLIGAHTHRLVGYRETHTGIQHDAVGHGHCHGAPRIGTVDDKGYESAAGVAQHIRVQRAAALLVGADDTPILERYNADFVGAGGVAAEHSCANERNHAAHDQQNHGETDTQSDLQRTGLVLHRRRRG
jgi:hypothetical protein